MAAVQSISFVCARCRQSLAPELFRLRKNGALFSYCRPCEQQYKREHYLQNRARMLEKSKEWRDNNRERKRQNDASYNRANKAKIAVNKREYFLRNKERELARSNEWRAKNLERQRGAEARYRERNRDACNERINDWKDRNKERLAAYAAVRVRKLRHAQPSWADKRAIYAVYRQARQRRLAGEDVHVDHVVPLVHPLVCGLHVPANLAIVPAIDNLRKNNRIWPDMP